MPDQVHAQTAPGLLKELPLRLHHNAYVCANQERTRHFYEDIIGLPLVATWIEEGESSDFPGRKISFVHTFFGIGDGGALAFFEFADPDVAAKFKARQQPLYVHLRKQGLPPDRAQDVVQGFLAHLLERDFLARLDPGRGRLRADKPVGARWRRRAARVPARQPDEHAGQQGHDRGSGDQAHHQGEADPGAGRALRRRRQPAPGLLRALLDGLPRMRAALLNGRHILGPVNYARHMHELDTEERDAKAILRRAQLRVVAGNALDE